MLYYRQRSILLYKVYNYEPFKLDGMTTVQPFITFLITAVGDEVDQKMTVLTVYHAPYEELANLKFVFLRIEVFTGVN